MPDFVVRNIPEEIYKRLQENARATSAAQGDRQEVSGEIRDA